MSNLLQLGLIACELGQLDRARDLAAEIERMARERQTPLELASAEYVRALVAAAEGTPAAAAVLLEQALVRRRSVGDQQGVVKTLTRLGHVRCDLGQPRPASEAFGEALHGAHSSGERVRVVRALEGCARCLAAREPDAAVRLAGAADAQRVALGTVAWPSEQRCLDGWLGAARHTLGASAFQRAWEDGHASTLAQAISLAEALSIGPRASPSSDSSSLSPRERDVAALLARGLTNKQIAAHLVVSPTTVRSHVEHILTKLDLRSRAQVAVWATQQGLLSGDPPFA